MVMRIMAECVVQLTLSQQSTEIHRQQLVATKIVVDLHSSTSRCIGEQN